MGRPKKEPLTFAAKVQKEFPEFTDEVDRLDVQALKNRIATYASELSESEDHKENNEALKDAQSEVKLITGPYSDVKKAVAKKTRYLLSLIKDKGGQ